MLKCLPIQFDLCGKVRTRQCKRRCTEMLSSKFRVLSLISSEHVFHIFVFFYDKDCRQVTGTREGFVLILSSAKNSNHLG